MNREVKLRFEGRKALMLVASFGLLSCLGCSDAAEFGRHRKSRQLDPAEVEDARVSTESPDAGLGPNTVPSTAPSIDEIGDLYEEEHCPDAVQRVERVECDPLAETDPERVSDCPEFEGCYPYVQYPSAPCEPETFGTRCDFAGTGLQGEPCAATRCAPGFLCVVTGRGMECAELCPLPGINSCAPGFICGSLDIDGFGVCI